MPPILNELIESLTINAIAGMLLFHTGLLFILLVVFPAVNLLLSHITVESKQKAAKIGTKVFVVIIFLSILDKMAFFHRYEEYEINNRNVGMANTLYYLYKDKQEQETIVFEDTAYITRDAVYSSGSTLFRPPAYQEGFLHTKNNTLVIPIGSTSSKSYEAITTLLFEKYDFPYKTNTIEVYKNSCLIKSINGVNINDTKKVQQFAISEKKIVYNDKLLDLFTASLDITEKGILVIPDNVKQNEFMENPNVIFVCNRWDETTQQYQLYGQKDLQREDASMFHRQEGKYQIYIAKRREKMNNISDIIEYEVVDAKIINLRIVDRQSQASRNIAIEDIESVINLIDYNDPILTEEEKEILRIREEMEANNQRVESRALENPNSDIFMNIIAEKLYFHVIIEGQAYPLGTEGYYNKHQREQAHQLAEDQDGMIFAFYDLDGNLIHSLPLKNATIDTQNILWEDLHDGDYVLQIKSTAVPTLQSNSLQITIQNHQLIRAYDYDTENAPLLWDIQYSTN